MNHGKSVRIYLADGSPAGLRHAELVNWTGQAIVCPRTRIQDLNGWPESHRPGVYFLLSEEEAAARVYIGEAENVFVRLKQHLGQKDFWEKAVFFTSKDENLTKAHVKYLEPRLIELARTANRCTLENSKAPNLPTLPRADRGAMEEFIEHLRSLLGALGYLFLQPTPGVISAPGREGVPSTTSTDGTSRLRFVMPKRNINAEGAQADEGFVVFAGSIGDKRVADTLTPGWRAQRDELIASGAIEVLQDTVRFTKNVVFKSPSAASSILSGSVTNGRVVWKNEAGRSINDLEQEIAQSEPTETTPGSDERFDDDDAE